MARPKIYIAGPECFKANCEELAKEMLALCDKYGFEGHSPALADPDFGPQVDFSEPDKRKVADAICRRNMWLIEHCDIVIANANNFRGQEPDGGTCFELGYAYGFGKKLYTYLDDIRPCVEKYVGEQIPDENGTLRDSEGRFFESGPLNLMLSAPSLVIEGDFETALKVAHRDYFGGEEVECNVY